MTQLYYLKNGGIGHYCDVYKEEVVEELSKMLRSRLASYVNEMLDMPSHFGNDAERLRKTLRVINLVKSSILSLNESLEVIADIEYHRVFSSDKNVSKNARDLVRKSRREY